MLAYMRTCVHICVDASKYDQMLGGGLVFLRPSRDVKTIVFCVNVFVTKFKFFEIMGGGTPARGIYVHMRAYMRRCCIYAEMRAYMCVCEHIYVDVTIYAEMRAYICICKHICVDACIHAEMCAHMCIREHICVDVDIRRCVHICAYAIIYA